MIEHKYFSVTLALLVAHQAHAQPNQARQQPPAVPTPAAHDSATPSQSGKLVTGWVVSIDGPDVVVDMGTAQGVHSGDAIELWRPIKLKHPVTGKLVTDRFRTGDLTLRQVRGNLSWARPVGALERPVAVGDYVQMRLAAQPVKDSESATALTPARAGEQASSVAQELPTNPPESQQPPERPRDVDALQVAQMFEAMRGRLPLERAANYEHYVRTHRTRFARVLYEEAALLRAHAEGGESDTAESGVVHEIVLPEVVRPDRPLAIGLWIPGKHAGAVLQVRAETEPSYHSFPMHPVSPDYYEVEIPREMMVPGAIALFIERVEIDGKAYPLHATSTQPVQIQVRTEPDRSQAAINHATLRLVTDYADWNRGRGNDYAWQTEGDLGFRLNDTGIRALRSGFGVYRGKGGTLAELDVNNVVPRSVGLTYGYLEGELGFSSFVGLIVRASVGLGEDGVTGGGQAFVRLGNDLQTNLMLGGEVLGGIGVRGIAQLELNQFENVPIVLRSEVTNQPIGTSVEVFNPATGYYTSRDASDVGVRAIAQVGYRLLPTLTLALRGSYQGRTINHAGPGAGAAVIYGF